MSLFGGGSTEHQEELIGEAEIQLDTVITGGEEPASFGREHYLYLEKSKNPYSDSIIKIDSLFVPDRETIERFRLDSKYSVFKSPQAFLFYKALTTESL
jgi:hypothetical protein